MAAVDQHGQLDAFGPAKVVERVHGRANGASAEKHVIDQHDGFAGHIEGNDCGLDIGRDALVQVIAVHADVQAAGGHRLAPNAGEQRAQAACAKGTPPRWMPTSTTSLLVSLRSAISWAIRVRAR